jgi:hypothetical protein
LPFERPSPTPGDGPRETGGIPTNPAKMFAMYRAERDD